eukprot:CAMPEP_0119124782 /NCGR_PEP_ID=MMETSP1310-20130426/4298_1 /TAXON_ID=464262 /ORGANISM="Genus nov. species nov., Strain RCC2339" /LENGTH=68 /DNA_ID=CAMNT_0007114785 /DNA_START=142 /DNA_END=345 /DNA_ORIENTATION=-
MKHSFAIFPPQSSFPFFAPPSLAESADLSSPPDAWLGGVLDPTSTPGALYTGGGVLPTDGARLWRVMA